MIDEDRARKIINEIRRKELLFQKEIDNLILSFKEMYELKKECLDMLKVGNTYDYYGMKAILIEKTLKVLPIHIINSHSFFMEMCEPISVSLRPVNDLASDVNSVTPDVLLSCNTPHDIQED